jgi:hypothetical protein
MWLAHCMVNTTDCSLPCQPPTTLAPSATAGRTPLRIRCWLLAGMAAGPDEHAQWSCNRGYKTGVPSVLGVLCSTCFTWSHTQPPAQAPRLHVKPTFPLHNQAHSDPQPLSATCTQSNMPVRVRYCARPGGHGADGSQSPIPRRLHKQPDDKRAHNPCTQVHSHPQLAQLLLGLSQPAKEQGTRG